MELLGSLLFVFAFINWLYPEGFGRWLGRVRNGLRQTSSPADITVNLFSKTRETPADD